MLPTGLGEHTVCVAATYTEARESRNREGMRPRHLFLDVQERKDTHQSSKGKVQTYRLTQVGMGLETDQSQMLSHREMTSRNPQVRSVTSLRQYLRKAARQTTHAVGAVGVRFHSIFVFKTYTHGRGQSEIAHSTQG